MTIEEELGIVNWKCSGEVEVLYAGKIHVIPAGLNRWLRDFIDQLDSERKRL
jgi:hypothetical protein